MAEEFAVDPEQLRRHAKRLEAIRDGFASIKHASASISQDDAAYGMLCGWIAGVLEERHARQDDLFALVEENLELAANALMTASQAYETADLTAAQRLQHVSSQS
ncbi:type VII secretion target [Micromonospora sp. HM5-17]|jgi:hypothetical protein|uniref:type VII secretion target n=1 Tax=Micromonospora sp. HM5-17 TaxID=2487710 RepID=UPI000F469CB3|nr:type VII secretion target [Micromonospora sp. HM5-17]ROT32969.1 hypothetical protein EF879_07385 [Micromonospora sp. HM5-17]